MSKVKGTTREEVINNLAERIDKFERYSQAHSQAMADMALHLANRLGLSQADAKAIAEAARLHDIGLEAMSPAYHASGAALRFEERLDLWRHSIIGEQEMAKREASRYAQLLVRWHHEWWNGSGYPDMLAFEDIPIGARILRAVELYNALICDRPYRPALAKKAALEVLQSSAGIECDPYVVYALLALLEEMSDDQEPEATVFSDQSIATEKLEEIKAQDAIATHRLHESTIHNQSISSVSSADEQQTAIVSQGELSSADEQATDSQTKPSASLQEIAPVADANPPTSVWSSPSDGGATVSSGVWSLPQETAHQASDEATHVAATDATAKSASSDATTNPPASSNPFVTSRLVEASKASSAPEASQTAASDEAQLRSVITESFFQLPNPLDSIDEPASETSATDATHAEISSTDASQAASSVTDAPVVEISSTDAPQATTDAPQASISSADSPQVATPVASSTEASPIAGASTSSSEAPPVADASTPTADAPATDAPVISQASVKYTPLPQMLSRFEAKIIELDDSPNWLGWKGSAYNKKSLLAFEASVLRQLQFTTIAIPFSGEAKLDWYLKAWNKRIFSNDSRAWAATVARAMVESTEALDEEGINRLLSDIYVPGTRLRNPHLRRWFGETDAWWLDNLRHNIEVLEDDKLRAQACLFGLQAGDYALSFNEETVDLRRPLTTVFWRLAGRFTIGAPPHPQNRSYNYQPLDFIRNARADLLYLNLPASQDENEGAQARFEWRECWVKGLAADAADFAQSLPAPQSKKAYLLRVDKMLRAAAHIKKWAIGCQEIGLVSTREINDLVKEHRGVRATYSKDVTEVAGGARSYIIVAERE